ncbi:OmpA family protein [Flavobacteriaceae bacterium]|nr:OmpA family protein [Flavobacteriaceae bacterium]
MDIRLTQKILSILVLFLSIGSGFSQTNELIQADKDFARFAYIDARKVYLKVVEDGYGSADIYKKLGDTYYWNSEYDNASKWYLRLVELFPEKTTAEYYLRAAQSLKTQGDYVRSDQMMEQYILLTGDNLIAKNFINNKEYLSEIAFQSKKYELVKTSINSATSDFGSAYYNGNIVFASADESVGEQRNPWTDQPYLDLFVAKRDSLGQLSQKEPLSDKINTRYHESSAVFTSDGEVIYFTRNNYVQGDRKPGRDKQRTVRLKLFKSTKDSLGNWTDALELPFNSQNYSTAHPALSVDEKRLYFSSDMPGSYGMSDLWYVNILEDGSYGLPINLGPNINTETRESFPFISQNGNLYFSSDGHPGLGGYDIFSAPITNLGDIGAVVNVGSPANSTQDDFNLIIEEDINLGYVSSNRHGQQGSSDDDIYRIQFYNCQIDITGTVVDSESQNPIAGATVKLLDENNQQISQQIASDKGTFSFPGRDCETQYTVRAMKNDFDTNEELFITPNQTDIVNVIIPLTYDKPCPPDDLGCQLKLPIIYFDFDKSFIREDAQKIIAQVGAAMKLYPDWKIIIGSHTDARGNDIYNEKLSGRRADATKNWLIQNGIDPSRLSSKGYGEYDLVNECKDGVECSEEQHQENRRSTFIRLKK